MTTTTTDLIALVRSHALYVIQYRTTGLHVSSSSILADIDDGRMRFLKELELSEECVFIILNFVHVQVRRDIAIIDIVHRAILWQGPPQPEKFFKTSSAPTGGALGIWFGTAGKSPNDVQGTDLIS